MGKAYERDEALLLRDRHKRVRIRCPLCGWEPDGKPYWGCEKCFASFDTFKTRAHCPNSFLPSTDAGYCDNRWDETQCIACQRMSPHDDWYVEDDDDDEE
jgi:hypothetical protein